MKLSNAWNSIADAAGSLPGPVLALAMLILGILAAKALRTAVSAFLRLVRFDMVGEKIGLTDFLRKGGVGKPPSKLVGLLCYWLAILAALLEAVRFVSPETHGAIAASLSSLLPGMAAAILISIVGSILAGFIGNFILTIALNASWAHARALSRMAKCLCVTLVVLLALSQLGVSRGILEFIIALILGSAALAAALAFGLGCKDLARDAVKKLLTELREHERVSRGGDLEG